MAKKNIWVIGVVALKLVVNTWTKSVVWTPLADSIGTQPVNILVMILTWLEILTIVVGLILKYKEYKAKK